MIELLGFGTFRHTHEDQYLFDLLDQERRGTSPEAGRIDYQHY
jgi:hypothetical protein